MPLTKLDEFVDALNEVSDFHREEFTANCPVSRAVDRDGLAPEAFLTLLVGYSGAAEEALASMEFSDLQETLGSLFERSCKIASSTA
jgi:hypothetical protein